MLYRKLGRTGEKVSAIGLGGSHIGRRDRGGGEHPHRPRRDRPRHHLHGQLLGLQRRRQRDPHGQGAARRLPREGLPDDQDRRPHQEGGRASSSTSRSSGCRPTTSTWCSTTRSSASRTRDRIFDRGRRQRGAARGASRRASSATSASPATRTRASTCTCSRSRREHGFTLRHRADAAQRHGRALPQLRASWCCPSWCKQDIGVLGMKSHGATASSSRARR